MKNKFTALVMALSMIVATAAYASTTHYSYNTPTVGGSQNTWGTLLNTIFNSIDTNIWSASSGTTIGLNSVTTGSTTALTNPINNVNNIAMTTTGKNLDMPPMNATASPVVGGTIWVNNTGSNSFEIMAADNSTAIVSSLPAGESVTLQPLTASTTDGTWQVYGPYITSVSGNVSLGTSASSTNPANGSAANTGLYSTSTSAVGVSILGTANTVWTAGQMATTGVVTASTALELSTTHAAPTAGTPSIYSPSAGALAISTTGAAAVTVATNGGVEIGTPTGGSEGAGTINVSGAGYYVNGTLFTGGISKVSGQTFTSNGTYTPTSGTKYAIFEVVGGGGGGGSSASGGGSAGGGGAGAYARVIMTAAQIGASQAITVGASGTGGAAGNNAGNNGGTTSVGSAISCPGGSGAAAGQTGTAVEAGGAGASAPTISSGTTLMSMAGQNGQYGGQAFLIINGGGASTLIGQGGGQAQIASSGSTTINGQNGIGYGSGGAGGLGGATNSTGGNGGTGAVIVTEFQ